MGALSLQQKQWAGEDNKQRLLTNSAAVMKAEGCDLPEGVETTEKQAWIVLPPKPKSTEAEVLEERLATFGYIGW